MILKVGKRSLQETFNVLSQALVETLSICAELDEAGKDITVRNVTNAFRDKGTECSVKKVYYRLKEGLVNKGYLAIRENRLEGNAMVFEPLGVLKPAKTIFMLGEPEMAAVYERRYRDRIVSVAGRISKNEPRSYIDPTSGEALSLPMPSETLIPAEGSKKDILPVTETAKAAPPTEAKAFRCEKCGYLAATRRGFEKHVKEHPS